MLTPEFTISLGGRKRVKKWRVPPQETSVWISIGHRCLEILRCIPDLLASLSSLLPSSDHPVQRKLGLGPQLDNYVRCRGSPSMTCCLKIGKHTWIGSHSTQWYLSDVVREEENTPHLSVKEPAKEPRPAKTQPWGITHFGTSSAPPKDDVLALASLGLRGRNRCSYTPSPREANR